MFTRISYFLKPNLISSASQKLSIYSKITFVDNKTKSLNEKNKLSIKENEKKDFWGEREGGLQVSNKSKSK